MDLLPLRRRDRRDRERDGSGARAGPRHRRDRTCRLPAADARPPARRDAAGNPRRARLRADPRPAGRGQAGHRQRGGLLGRRHLFRQRPVAEREGAPPGPCARSGPRDIGPERAHLPDDRAPAFPHRFVRYRRAVVPEDREIGRAVVADQLDGDLQRNGKAAPGPRRAAVPAVPDRPARRGAGGQEAVFRDPDL